MEPGQPSLGKVFIRTFGCQANFYDSSRIREAFLASGYRVVDDMHNADVFVMNTCHVREKAGEKVFSELGRVRTIKNSRARRGQPMVIVVTGCVAKAEGKNIFERMPMVDAVVSVENQHRIPSIVEEILQGSGHSKMVLATEDLGKERKFAVLPERRTQGGVSETIVIQDGCDKFCSYCTVPFTRGREYSRPVDDVLREANWLVGNGTREITLLGQNVDNYGGLDRHGRRTPLGELIRMVSSIGALERIRYLTSYPSQFGDDLIELHRDLPKLMPLIYIPAQSGSNGVLKSMNRRYTREQYLDLIRRIRGSVKDIAFSSDFIVGFPGETEEDFEATLNLVETVDYALAFSFKYSPRPKTASIRMPNQVPEDVKTERLDRLQALLDRQRINFNGNHLGKIVEVLVENALPRSKNTFFGKTPHSQPVLFTTSGSPELVGSTVRVRINGVTLRTLKGELLEIC
ncbi:MAG: tRNA (N6-isopentenyl adenosine(37)-C2)-methylthiotransferase MiaB [Rickettsiales bacterium]|jgi:tRNA-2-methylthio-N6-dimethylallyladenosine synthase|nr:tRNA (N6-isopentenyl adenosine(37)-C2)-methylthiotransferase MiaB [Rickettsiales bacterium]